MDGAERTAFINQYTKLVIAAWSDEAVMNRLKSDPLATAKEYGLDIPPGGSVKLVSQIPAEGDHSPELDVQLRLWDEGKQSGVYELHVPETPQLDTAELDEMELSQVAGGTRIDACCCCPCCCCT
jgi:hypothetical protein